MQSADRAGIPVVLASDRIDAGLNRLREKSSSRAKYPKDIPQGLEPALILLTLRRD
jgi:hypothetical protein